MARRPAVLLLCLVLALLCVLPGFASAVAEAKTIRVGWYETPFNRMDSLGRRSGYAYEYQRKIAAYTGWKYEYVEGNWPELLQMAMDGRIDLMSDVSYAEDRTEYLLYADLPMGSELYYLYVSPENKTIAVDDLASLNGKKVGVTKSSVQKDFFLRWAEERGVTADLVELESSAGRLRHSGYLRGSGIRRTDLENRLLRFLFRGQQKPSGSAGGAQRGAEPDPGREQVLQ